MDHYRQVPLYDCAWSSRVATKTQHLLCPDAKEHQLTVKAGQSYYILFLLAGRLPFASAFSTETRDLLGCTNLTNQSLAEQNLTIQWTRDFQIISQNDVDVKSTGFYCCQVLNGTGTVLTICATLLGLGKSNIIVKLSLLQWNLSIMVTLRPTKHGCYREVTC